MIESVIFSLVGDLHYVLSNSVDVLNLSGGVFLLASLIDDTNYHPLSPLTVI